MALFPASELGSGPLTPHHKRSTVLQNVTKCPRHGPRFFGMTYVIGDMKLKYTKLLPVVL